MSTYRVKTEGEFMDDGNFKNSVPVGWASNHAMKHLFGKNAKDILHDDMLKRLELMFQDKEATNKVVMRGSLGGWTLWKRDFIRTESSQLIAEALEII